MLKAVQFGAGNIGRGFTAQLFTESGYEVVFVDIADPVVGLINNKKSYPIEIVGDGAETVTIKNIRAVNSKDIDSVASEIQNAPIVCTAVGVNVLKFIAPAIAAGIKLRAEGGVESPLNIIICENLLHASDILKGYILAELPDSLKDYVDSHVGFVESVVSRMVPVMTEEDRKKDPLRVVVEAYKTLPVDKKGFVGPIPEIAGFSPYDNFEGYVERKLFTHNLGHASAAYLGYLKGYHYIYQAVADPEIRDRVNHVLGETGKALIQKWGFTPEEHQAHIDDLLKRFANAALGDTVARVGRDPIRKLGPNDRIIGGAKLAASYGIEPQNTCLVAAAALLYDNPEDDAAVKVQSIIRDAGVLGVLEGVCGLDPKGALASEIEAQFNKLKSA